MTLKFSIIGAVFFGVVTEVINEATESASKVGTLGMQGLLAFMLIILFIVIYYQEKKRTDERHRRDAEQESRFNTVIKHHEESVAHFNTERSAFTTTLIDLNQKSVAAMEGMTVAMDGFKEWLQDRAITPTSQRRMKRK